MGTWSTFCKVCAELGGAVQPGPVLPSMSHASATALALHMQTGKRYCLSPTQHLPGQSCPQSRRAMVLLLGEHVATRHVPAQRLELRDACCRLRVSSTQMLTDTGVQKTTYQPTSCDVKYTAGFKCKGTGLIQDWQNTIQN